MAKKKTSGKTKSFSEAIGLQYIFNNTITDFFLGLALLVVAVVMILAMISFLSTGAADQSLLENLQPGEWTNTQQLFQNYCGSMGAILSYWLMAVNFGFPAFLIPCFVVMVGFQLMNVYRVNLWKWFFTACLWSRPWRMSSVLRDSPPSFSSWPSHSSPISPPRPSPS